MYLSRFIQCKVCGLHWFQYDIIVIDKDIETKPNDIDVYGLIDGKLYGIYYSDSCHFNSL